jgi:hypothetical protein
MSDTPVCKVCGAKNHFLFSEKILGKYNISYYKCEFCGFIQTEEPYWTEEAYHSAITNLDIGYVYRNLMYKDFVSSFIAKNKPFNPSARFLDYGGGYGLFVRLMRDIGFDYYREDLYCENIFAQYFDVKDINTNQPFEMLTCFEVFEHLVNPVSEIEKMLNYSKSILFSTELQPNIELKSSDDWQYFAPETGQHIAFFTKKSLEVLAEKFGLNLYTDNQTIHLLTDKVLNISCISAIHQKPLYERIYNRLFHPKNRKAAYNWFYVNKDAQYVKSIV